MYWFLLVIASFGEIFGVASINFYLQNKTWKRLLFVIITFSFGFLFLRLAMGGIPLSTAYAVWTGLGAAGAVIIGIVLFHESTNWKRLVFLLFIITGAIGLKLTE